MRGTRSLVALGLSLAACSVSDGGGFAAPATLDSGTWEKVDRTVENDLMASAVGELRALGLTEAFGAAYEFITYKPQFFFGAGRGRSDREAVMDAALPLFGGENGFTEPPREVARGGATFLCGPYTHTGVPGSVGGSGLVSIAAACSWADGETAGFAIGVAGPGVEDVLKMTVEARTEVLG